MVRKIYSTKNDRVFCILPKEVYILLQLCREKYTEEIPKLSAWHICYFLHCSRMYRVFNYIQQLYTTLLARHPRICKGAYLAEMGCKTLSFMKTSIMLEVRIACLDFPWWRLVLARARSGGNWSGGSQMDLVGGELLNNLLVTRWCGGKVKDCKWLNLCW